MTVWKVEPVSSLTRQECGFFYFIFFERSGGGYFCRTKRGANELAALLNFAEAAHEIATRVSISGWIEKFATPNSLRADMNELLGLWPQAQTEKENPVKRKCRVEREDIEEVCRVGLHFTIATKIGYFWTTAKGLADALALILDSADSVAAERDEARKLLERADRSFNFDKFATGSQPSLFHDIRAFLSKSAPAQPTKRERAIALIDDWLARDPIAGEDADLERLKLALNASADNRKPFPAQPEKPPTVEMRPSLADTYRPLYTMPTPTVEERVADPLADIKLQIEGMRLALIDVQRALQDHNL